MIIDIPQVMGIVNVTPDSFSDGALHDSTDAAIAHGLKLLSDGADWLDIGGESTRPGATPVSAEDEMARVLPVVRGLRERTDALLSVDTMKPDVAIAAVSAGADMWNYVPAGRFSSNSLQVAAELGCKICLMHMLGEPQSMQVAPSYSHVVKDVAVFLKQRSETARKAGVKPDNIWIDPGIGFGKTLAHNLRLIRDLDKIAAWVGQPILFGASRKSFIRGVDPTAENASDRIGGSLAVALEAARRGASIIRVHDVRETVQALKVQAAVKDAARRTT